MYRTSHIHLNIQSKLHIKNIDYFRQQQNNFNRRKIKTHYKFRGSNSGSTRIPVSEESIKGNETTTKCRKRKKL